MSNSVVLLAGASANRPFSDSELVATRILSYIPPNLTSFPLSLLSQVEVKKHILRAALKKGVADGTLVQNKNSYKLSAEAKAKKAAPKKAAVAKKAAPKKKVCVFSNLC